MNGSSPPPASTPTERTVLLALHGFSLQGHIMRYQMGPLADELERFFSVEYPDGPHACPRESVERLWQKQPPPHGVVEPRMWWRASPDGASYEGWQTTTARLAPLLAQANPVGVLGFSQGAMVAATLAALSVRGELPPIAFAVLIAGGAPRAADLRPYFRTPIAVPSLHVVGRRDELMKDAPLRLLDCFAAEHRLLAQFDGGHVVPRRGPVTTQIVEFCKRYAGRRGERFDA